MSDSTPSAAPSLPLVRDCRPGGLRPLLAPGGRETYFSPDVQRMLFAADEPIARFLPPAKWSMPDRVERAQDGRAAQVSYTVPDEMLKTATPLVSLIQSEIEAFADAVAVFLAKARPDAKGVPPFIRQCRQDFRLPDPDIDPSSYWVYGPEFDRRLLILWGCEVQASPSLPLDKVVEKLRARAMSWRDKQDLGLKLALRNTEGLSRFLAPRSQDGGLVIGGVNVPVKKLNRLKTIAPGEWQAFETAAKAYYAKAHPEVAGAAPFEKEVRAAFRLPGVAQAAGDFYLHGSKLVIALDAWREESTLPLTDDPVLKLPVPTSSTGAAAVAVGGDTVSGQLKSRRQPVWIPYAKLAAAVVVLAGVGSGVWWATRPPPAPQFVEAKATDEHTVVLTFSTPISEASLQPKPGAAGARPEDPLTFFDDKMKITGRSLSAGVPNKVIVRVDGSFADGEKYGIAITKLAHPKGRAIEPSNAEFVYNDQRAPKLDKVSAGGKTKKNLLLVFTIGKPLKESTITPARFLVAPVEAGQAGRRMNIVGAELDKEDKTGATVLLEAADEFVGGKTYVITVTGVTDDAAKPNPLDEKGATNREFRYVNILPPRLNEVVASGGKFELALTFNAPLAKEIALSESNYVLMDSDKKPLRLLKGGIKLDDAAPNTVVLRLESQRLSPGQHQLTIAKMIDRQGNATTAPIERSFAFNDATDRKAPTLVSIEGTGEKGTVKKTDQTLRLQFDRAVDLESASAVAHYRVLGSDFRGIQIKSVAPASDDPSRVILQLAGQFSGVGDYTLETNGLVNVFGVNQLTPATAAFKVGGSDIRASSLIDWAQPPLLKANRQTLVLSIRPRITEESARVLANYAFEPGGIKIEKVEKFELGTEEDRVSVVTLRLAAPVSESVAVWAQNLMIEGRPLKGPQFLNPRPAMFGQ